MAADKRPMSFPRPPLSVLELTGTATDVAFALGRARRRAIPGRIAHWDRHLAERFAGRRALQKDLERALLREARRQAPRYLEEIHAMAEGAGVGFAALFRLNLTELSVFSEKCTDLILPMRVPGGQRILLAHNEDWDPRRNDCFVLKARLPEVEYAVLAYDGYLPGLSAGMNSFGLAHSVNYLRPKDFRVGLPRIFLARHLVTARDISDCLSFLSGSRRAFGQAIHLAQGSRYLGIELTARHAALRRPRLPACHSNHYLAAALQRFVPRGLPSSLARLRRARQLLREVAPRFAAGPPTPEQARRLARRILSDRESLPWALWREADRPEEGSATLAAVLVGTDRWGLEIHRRRPVENKAIRIAIDRP